MIITYLRFVPRASWLGSRVPAIPGLLILLTLMAAGSSVFADDLPVTSATASSAIWPVTNLFDGNLSSEWSSSLHDTAQNQEWMAYWFTDYQFHNVNYVKLAPRLSGTQALGFPVEFSILWSDGSNWNVARCFTHFSTPQTHWVTLPLPLMVSANGIYIQANVLGADETGHYAFQIAEATAGYDPNLDAVVYTPNAANASSTTPGWPASNVYDGINGTVWSSLVHSSASSTESLAIAWPQGAQKINYVKLMPRYTATNQAQGFPVNYTLQYLNGTSWTTAVTHTNYPTPLRGDWIILPLPGVVTTAGIKIQATMLGQDSLNNYVLQLAEVKVGYHPAFNQFSYAGNDASASRNLIENVGSESLDRPAMLANWNYDDRGIVIAPQSGTYRNIYAPQAVQTGTNHWNVYFGGWDGSSSENDQVSMITTADNFMTFGAHALVIAHGTFIHANNDCVVKLDPTHWRMVYTTYPTNNLNKPGYATSTDGLNWWPNSGNASYLLSMTGYSNWSYDDDNGCNVIFNDADGTWHLYFIDFSATHTAGVLHATSADAIHFTYQGVALNSPLIANDLRAFSYGGTTYYVALYHMNSQHVWYTIGTNLTTLGPDSPPVAFANEGTTDSYIVAAGLVQDGSRIYGILYGAGPHNYLTDNRIYARWLQKKVIFQNANVRWGDVENAYGPDQIRLTMASGDNVETGNFYVYDTDGVSLLYVSPPVSMRAGDIWNYVGSEALGQSQNSSAKMGAYYE